MMRFRYAIKSVVVGLAGNDLVTGLLTKVSSFMYKCRWDVVVKEFKTIRRENKFKPVLRYY